MIYGTAIDSQYLKDHIAKYKNVPLSDITAKDRGDVAFQLLGTHKQAAVDHVDREKRDYGNGVSTLVLVYNATGDRISVHDSYSWHGHFYSEAPDETVENGQWSSFLHVHTSGAAVGSKAATIYRSAADTDMFVGWESPWSGTPSVYADSQKKDYWWDVSSKDSMGDQIDDGGSRSDFKGEGFELLMDIGDSTSPYCNAILRKN
ncbi:LOC100283929 [Rhizoctonia solani]|uniref:LOC100283929 n=1 Tax=Rhizoctonia solani TaxID=456999 RepID=A0A0K6GGS6_9AGAM|nr:LOC100283929 [Rhizoctonia solani]